MSTYYYPEYVPVAQKRAKAARKLSALRKKNPNIRPVVIEGRSIVRTWWGKSWNQNLERYADYSNRIGRGRSYVRHGAVLDLQIEPGKIHARVQGSRARPYEVVISIKALNKSNWERVRNIAEGQLDSLAELLAGGFPKSLQESFFAREEGLFPAPKEISFDCSCPDWASMCKHVAASLYGVGARLDEDPSLFFELRRIKMDDLVTQAVKTSSQALLKKAESRSARVIDDEDLTEVFGIKLDDDIDFEDGKSKRSSKRTARAKKRSGSRKQRIATKPAKGKVARRKASGKAATRGKATAKSAKTSTARRRPPAKPAKGRTVPSRGTGGSIVDTVVSAIPKRRKAAASIADICARVDLSEKQVRNAVARAVIQGRLRACGRGVYTRP